MCDIGMSTRQIKNVEVFEVWRLADLHEKNNAVYQHILNYYELEESPQLIKNSVKKTARLFCMRASTYWRSSSRMPEVLNTKYKIWLDNYLATETIVKDYCFGNETVGTSSAGIQSKRGRPKNNFTDLNLASKKRRVLDLVQTRDSSELEFAAKWSSHKSPDKESLSSLSPFDALTLYIDLDLSYRKYNRLREVVNLLHPNTFPSYETTNKIMKVRDEILPNAISSTETVAEVNLQDLLYKTAESIVKTAEKSKEIFTVGSSLTLICKWGFDGSSGHSTYKQKFHNDNASDEFLFLTALVPIRLVDNETQLVKWQNKTPSSTYFCRPIRLLFNKETTNLIKEEERRVGQLINDLESSVIKLQEPSSAITISYDMIFTMIDGAVCDTLSGVSSTQTCYICGATPKLMNSPSVFDRVPNTTTYKYGLSTLHNWIRSFEFLLHVAYRLPLKCWQVRGQTQKDIFNENKKRIQKEFKQKMGLIVDKPKPGYGSTNDGNTARIFFKNSTLSNEITGIDQSLIEKFYLINRIISSGFKINLDKFKELLKETNSLYLSLYSWYNIPTSIHKILVHSTELIQSFPLPIGQLSEDALEGRHKDSRNYREHHTRKTSRPDTNHDLITMMLLTSDPLISTIRSGNKHKKNILDPDLSQYLDL